MTAPAANRTAIVHIGLNKTGSTTLQRWLQVNRAALRERGVWFDDLPPHGGPELSTAMGWSIFAASENPLWQPGPWQAQAYRIDDRADLDARVATFLDRVEASLPQADGLYVTSSEHIGTALRKPEQIARLHGWFAARFETVRYVVYIRDQADWVASAYVQAIRSGAAMGLDDFIAKQGRNDYHALARLWWETAGPDALIVRRLDPAALVQGDLIADFAAQLGVSPDGLQRPERQNESMTAFRLRLTRRVSQHLGPAMERLRLLPLQRQLYSTPLPNPLGLKKMRLSATQAARVRRMNLAGNEALRAALCPDETALFPSSAPTATARPLTPDEAAQHYGRHKAVVHIGMPKTGTGTIQAWLDSNRGALATQGFAFPAFDDLRGTGTRHQFAFALMAVHSCGTLAPDAHMRRLLGIATLQDQAALVETLCARLDAELAREAPTTFLISSEWLSAWLNTEERVRAFHAFLTTRFAEARYIVYLRDQVSWFPSAYAQQVKVGETATLDEFIARRPERDYLRVCNIWQRGTDRRLDIRLLERDFLTDGDLLADYAARIGARLDATRRIDPRNTAFSRRSVRLWRWINARAQKRGADDRVRRWRNLYARLPLARMGARLDLPPQTARQVARLNADKNAVLQQRYFPDRPYLFARAHQLLAETQAGSGATQDQVA